MMDIHEWNAVFVLMGGSVVCSGCSMAQPLEGAEKRFQHLPGCKHDDQETQHPWVMLHDILDVQRG